MPSSVTVPNNVLFMRIPYSTYLLISTVRLMMQALVRYQRMRMLVLLAFQYSISFPFSFLCRTTFHLVVSVDSRVNRRSKGFKESVILKFDPIYKFKTIFDVFFCLTDSVQWWRLLQIYMFKLNIFSIFVSGFLFLSSEAFSTSFGLVYT